MGEVHLTGELVCSSEREAALVEEYLPAHIALTRAELGCLSFEVTRIGESMIWRVEERFHSEAAFRVHQERVTSSEWGRKTAGITRKYVVEGPSS
ncbi:MAG: putative quinol monooxygenase [Pauljensenia sp.]